MSVLTAIPPAVIYILGGLIIALAIFLSIVIAKQSGKEEGLSGTIVGGSESYFGKNKGADKNAVLAKLTIIGSILLVVVSAALMILVKISF
ncbi:MAG: preprotein translocase subunit SecG [Ruminococcaceae bacterium]|nr:preprotein translocase subunit SecG [Oscillospiraceae bacterium]